MLKTNLVDNKCPSYCRKETGLKGTVVSVALPEIVKRTVRQYLEGQEHIWGQIVDWRASPHRWDGAARMLSSSTMSEYLWKVRTGHIANFPKWLRNPWNTCHHLMVHWETIWAIYLDIYWKVIQSYSIYRSLQNLGHHLLWTLLWVGEKG